MIPVYRWRETNLPVKRYWNLIGWSSLDVVYINLGHNSQFQYLHLSLGVAPTLTIPDCDGNPSKFPPGRWILWFGCDYLLSTRVTRATTKARQRLVMINRTLHTWRRRSLSAPSRIRSFLLRVPISGMVPIPTGRYKADWGHPSSSHKNNSLYLSYLGRLYGLKLSSPKRCLVRGVLIQVFTRGNGLANLQINHPTTAWKS